MRPSIVVEGPDGNILVDTTPELRLQSIAAGLNRIDAVLITHTHADHIFGMDDLRRFNDLCGHDIPVYGSHAVLEDIRRIYRYVFIETQAGGGKPRLSL
jgi:phosphoribosyl 1,2-cyclic phosphate phosphodiesterase